ncbi:hypothetical protein AAEO56_04390 [Flavobacterium sp. DGU11]|uniref:Uncharacterized protein n=1 Tax=Flavobacterium arundinis TaxID=3139143 RepID=A0ABU9HU31_9FLAO
MQAIRKMVNSNKGFITFWLLLFFLTAGQAKAFFSAAPSGYKKEIARTESSKQQLSIAEDSSSFSFLEQINDGDIDDMPFAFFSDFSFSATLTRYTQHLRTNAGGFFSNGCKVPLYKLYCNWKFDFPA